MQITVREATIAAMEAYAHVSTAFRVARRLVLSADPSVPSGVTVSEDAVVSPFVKDYDALPGNHPTEWARRLDTAQWRVFAAFVGDARVGGAILILPSDHADVPRVAELWDLRVSPAWRRRGVARTLWAAVEAAAFAARARGLEVETQQINVAACRLYHAQGCVLTRVDPAAYPELPDEVALHWYKALPARSADLTRT
jgi:ribosomal protein S18 acetylase RimI-like enzyme